MPGVNINDPPGAHGTTVPSRSRREKPPHPRYPISLSDGVTLKHTFINIRDTGEFVTNLVTLKPKTSPVAVENEIRDAFERNADLDANGISVTVSDGKVELSGQVHSLHEANIAESAAWSAPGVQRVERHLTVTP